VEYATGVLVVLGATALSAGLAFLPSSDPTALAMCGPGYDIIAYGCAVECGSFGTIFGIEIQEREYVEFYCSPDGIDLVAATPSVTLGDNCGAHSFGNQGWYVYDGNFVQNESSGDPPVMIYDYATSNLTYPEDYRLSCDKFYQVVSDTADNKAWTGRVRTGSNYVVNDLGGYVYGDEDPPFGSALQPIEVKSPEDWDGISSTEEYDRLVFRENLSETVISGLPYGCHDDLTLGNTCDIIGRCSNHEEILCAHPYPGGAWDYGVEGTDEHYLDLQCPAGETCNLISNLGVTTPAVAKDVISSLFVESYRTVIWDWNTNRYDIDNITDNILPPANCSPVGTTDRYTATNGPTCRILPIVGNETLEGGSGNIIWDGVSGSFTIPASGYYTLKFTSRIDEEQLPLTRIDINWADGNIDSPAAYGELNDRPAIEEPHEFIHYYTIGTYSGITITLTDNWGTSASN
ncbi:hypothetical protein KJ695_05175, partial [Patescibacteria group bacterium]|nr:hypothetical protein [Patescibacteria group bacterium]